jgi:probable HAF family extracellular repeat protein
VRSRFNRRQSAVATLVTCMVSCLVIGADATPGGGVPGSSESCVRNVGDLNRDGLADYAVSRSVNGASIVYLVFGESLPATTDPERHHGRVVVLRGPFAAPFLCPDPLASFTTRPLRTGGNRQPARLAESPIGRPVSYTVVDLDPLMPGALPGTSSVTARINARGEIIGHFITADGEHAFVYDGNEVRDLGTLGGSSSFARSINDRSEIVGYSLTGEFDASGLVNEAFLSDGHTMKSLGLRWSSAEHINNRGQIVGEMLVQPNLNHAFLYENGQAIDLGSLPPLGNAAHSVALAINDRGQIVGESNTFVTGEQSASARFDAVHAFLYENGALRDLGTFGKVCASFLGTERCLDRSSATDINSSGHVVGFSTGPAGGTHAFLGTADGLHDLGTLEGGSSFAYGINDSGQIVGGSQSPAGEFSPFLFDRGTMYDLSALIVGPPGDEPFTAYAINNFGQIAGNHHLLNPVYDTVEDGRDFSFLATLGATLRFEYWVSATDRAAPCRGLRSRPQLQVRIGATTRPGPWLPVGVLRGCDSTDWASVSLTIPEELRNSPSRIHIRLQQTGPLQDARVHLRRFSMD